MKRMVYALFTTGAGLCCFASAGGGGTNAASAGDAAAQPAVNILWLGSSSTYYNNMPWHVVNWLSITDKTRRYASRMMGRSGTGVHVYLRPDFKAEYGLGTSKTVLDLIRDGKFTYVVLQAVTHFAAGDEGGEYDKAVDTYCKAIRAAGGEPVFYEMGWGSGAVHDRGKQCVFDQAVRDKVLLVAPCATAWERVRRERPALKLQHPKDNSHPGDFGNYLNLCCLYSMFTGKPATNMPATLRVWYHAKEGEGEPEHAVEPGLEAYASTLAGWMKRNTMRGPEFTVPPDVAAYLATVAFEETRAYRKRLEEAIAEKAATVRASDQTGLK